MIKTDYMCLVLAGSRLSRSPRVQVVQIVQVVQVVLSCVERHTIEYAVARPFNIISRHEGPFRTLYYERTRNLYLHGLEADRVLVVPRQVDVERVGEVREIPVLHHDHQIHHKDGRRQKCSGKLCTYKGQRKETLLLRLVTFLPVVAKKSLLSLSQMIQSVVMMVMAMAVATMEEIQNDQMRSLE